MNDIKKPIDLRAIVAKLVEAKLATPPAKMAVKIDREPGMDFLVLTLEDGTTEELDVDDTREWFRLRGANMDKIDKALDYVWNFYHATVNINMPKAIPFNPLEPQV